MKKFFILTTLVVSIFYSQIKGQCLLIPVDLETRIASSDLIVEASLIDQQSFRDPVSYNIYTANYLKIYKIFKGKVEDDEIVLISPGGQIDDSGEEVIPSIYVREGITGVFFLYDSEITGDASLQNFRPFSGPQACIYYSESGTANDAFTNYSSVENELYPLLAKLLGNSKQEVNKLNFFVNNSNKSATQVTGVFPDTTISGIKEEIIIRGLDFGATQGIGKVEFKNASTGPAFIQPVGSQYRFWSDTMIIVRVPANAGTGIMKVTQNGVGLIGSPFFKFAHLNYFNFSRVLEPYHKDNNGSGGFTWRLNTKFDTLTGAKNSFTRAMTTWSDETCINWENGPPTTVNRDMEDGINIVRFSNAGELPTGVLGITRNRWKVCNSSISYTGEIDLSYSPDINWHMDPGIPPLNKYDMESVIVHELGHAHQLGHVNDRADFMFATIGQGQNKRRLVDNNIEGGLYIMKKSVVPYACGPAPMKGTSGCNIPVGLAEQENLTKIRVYPNPFSDVLFIENVANESFNLGIFNVMGVQIAELIIPENAEKITWNVPQNLPKGLYLLKNLHNGKLISKVILRP